jgi:hypothetical protein
MGMQLDDGTFVNPDNYLGEPPLPPAKPLPTYLTGTDESATLGPQINLFDNPLEQHTVISPLIDTNPYVGAPLPAVHITMPQNDPAVVKPPIDAIDPNRTQMEDIKDMLGFMMLGMASMQREKEKKKPFLDEEAVSMLFIVGAVVLLAYMTSK